MNDNLQHLRGKISRAKDLGHVVRTMKVLAASNVVQFERAAQASAGYYQTVETGLAQCLRLESVHSNGRRAGGVGAIVFGTDQGLVGQFNEVLAEFVAKGLDRARSKVWVVGERLQTGLQEMGFDSEGLFPVPNSIPAISPLIGLILDEVEQKRTRGEIDSVLVFHNRPVNGVSYKPNRQQIIPFDEAWRREIASQRWPTQILPEVIDPEGRTLSALVMEYLFLALFRACTQSLAAENISRMISMQAAQQNITDLLAELTRVYQRTRQDAIDEELFDVVSSFKALME